MPKTLEKPEQLPVWIVTGVNWTMEVPTKEYSFKEYTVEFDGQTTVDGEPVFNQFSQQVEAATIAVEVFKHLRSDYDIVLNPDSRNEKPLLGVTVNVHEKGTDPDAAAIIFTHICLGNTGLYKEAMIMEQKFNHQVAELRKREQAKQAEAQKRAKEIQDFEKLKKEYGPKAKKKS